MLVDFERDVVAEARAEPARQQVAPAPRCRARAASAPRRRPATATRAATATSPCAPTRCPTRRRAGRDRRDLRSPGQVGPLGRVDDQPVDDVDELLERARPPLRPAAPPQEHRQVRDQQTAARSTPAPRRGCRAGSARSPRRRSHGRRPGSSASTPARRARRARPASARGGASATDAAPPCRRASPRRPPATPAAPTRCASSPTCAGSAVHPPPPSRRAAARARARSPRSTCPRPSRSPRSVTTPRPPVPWSRSSAPDGPHVPAG